MLSRNATSKHVVAIIPNMPIVDTAIDMRVIKFLALHSLSFMLLDGVVLSTSIILSFWPACGWYPHASGLGPVSLHLVWTLIWAFRLPLLYILHECIETLLPLQTLAFQFLDVFGVNRRLRIDQLLEG